jgi:hypothetical protein
MKRDFAGLTEKMFAMTADAIYINPDNPYFANGEIINYRPDNGLLAIEQPRDMTACFDSDKIAVEKFFRETYQNAVYKYVDDEFMTCALLADDSYPTAGKINADVFALLKEYYTKEKCMSFFKDKGIPEKEIDFWGNSWTMQEYAGKFVQFAIWGFNIEYKGVTYEYPYLRQPLLYDLNTGEEFDWRSLVNKDWLKKQSVGKVGFDKLVLKYIDWRAGDVVIGLQQKGDFTGPEYELKVPEEFINW